MAQRKTALITGITRKGGARLARFQFTDSDGPPHRLD
jgi:hypothetical protein